MRTKVQGLVGIVEVWGQEVALSLSDALGFPCFVEDLGRLLCFARVLGFGEVVVLSWDVLCVLGFGMLILGCASCFGVWNVDFGRRVEN